MSCGDGAGLRPALTQLQLCGCSVAALLSLAGTQQGLDRLKMLLSSEQALRELWETRTDPLPAVPEAVLTAGLARMLQRGEVGAGPCSQELFLQEAVVVCLLLPVPTSPQGWHEAASGMGISRG